MISALITVVIYFIKNEYTEHVQFTTNAYNICKVTLHEKETKMLTIYKVVYFYWRVGPTN